MFRIYTIAAIACLALLSSCSGEAPKENEIPLNNNADNQVVANGQMPEQIPEEEFVPEPSIVNKDWTDEEKMQLLDEFQSGARRFDFYASFTEPFWTFYFFGNQVLFESMGSVVPQVIPLEYPFSDRSDEQTMRFMLFDQLWELEVIRGDGSDGMSELIYPYIVKGELMEGGGGTSFVNE